MQLRPRLLPFLFLAVAACSIPRTDHVSRLSAAPVLSGGSYTSGGGLTVALDVREAAGLTEVCGVWAISKQQSILTKLAERQVLGSASVRLGGQRIVSNLLYMKRVDPAPSYAGLEANCTSIDRVWRPGDERLRVSIDIPQQIVANESDGGDIFISLSGPVVWFKHTGPGAGGG